MPAKPTNQLLLFDEEGNALYKPEPQPEPKPEPKSEPKPVPKKQRKSSPAEKPRAAKKAAEKVSHPSPPMPSRLPMVVPPEELTGLAKELALFTKFGTATICHRLQFPDASGNVRLVVPVFTNEYWTSRQRAAHSLHEVSYRACFKPQLPCFFIERLTNPGDVVYDPFLGRGTTPLEAALLGRVAWGGDANPLSKTLLDPRLNPPTLEEIKQRLQELDLKKLESEPWEELRVFYHEDTLTEITALRDYLLRREREGSIDQVDRFIRMVAINRLTGHSGGFFSVYSLPPNQAVTIASQKRINSNRSQVPDYRDVKKIVEKKAKQLLKELSESQRENLAKTAPLARTVQAMANEKGPFPDNSVDLVVTSPPFLDVVQYETDNWLRCWFIGVDAAKLGLSTPKRLHEWMEVMLATLKELHRIVKPGGHVAFEVGEVKGCLNLDEIIAPLGQDAGFNVELIMINAQEFTKTSHAWGVDNQVAGTNTNRIVLLRKEAKS